MFVVVTLVSSAGTASAAPTASFTFAPTAPVVAQPVTFTFTGACDATPCRITWRWFTDGGSSLGTTMGEGEVISYAFSAVGTYSVVAKITNATSTHGSATATQAVAVHATYQETTRRVGYGAWRGATTVGVAGGYRVAGGAASMLFTGSDITYVGRTGPSRGIATVRVDGTVAGTVDLYAPSAGSLSFPVTGLLAGTHRIGIRSTNTKNPASSGTAISLDEFVVGSTHVDDNAYLVTYDRWAGSRNTAASGGTVRTSASAGAATTLSFTARSVTWVTATGPAHGLASIAIDGVQVATVDNYSATPAWQVKRTFAGLVAGSHTITIRVLGTHSAGSTGNRVTVDAFVVQ